jgi:hypothetical protein
MICTAGDVVFPTNIPVQLDVEPVDMRKHFDSLWAVAQNLLAEDPKEGVLFVLQTRHTPNAKSSLWIELAFGPVLSVSKKELLSGRAPPRQTPLSNTLPS